MTIDTTSKAARRQIADEFKERKVPRGIFAVRCSATGEAWVGSSPNLGRYRNTALQQAWAQHGEDAFSLEALEQFDDEVSALLLNDLFVTKKKNWAETLGGNVL